MNEVLNLVKEFGLPLVIAIGALYALYKFFFFSVREVKDTFTKRHEINAKKMEEVKITLAEIKSDLKLLIEFIKEINNKRK
tara:strand:- start:1768 stop:2010 length:243 start_codon:yes stop_codon:yes gene_type:complete